MANSSLRGSAFTNFLVLVALAALVWLGWRWLGEAPPAVDPVIEAAATEPTLDYPDTRTVEQADTYFGVEVADPYRWLEEEARVSEAVSSWVAAQNAVTFDYLDGLEDRYRIRRRLTELWDYEKFSLPVKEGGRYFYRRNDGLQNQSALYLQDALDGDPRLLLDPNTWSADGATALGSYLPSPDGKLLLYAIQDAGSDWRTLKVLDTDTGRVLDDSIEWVKSAGLAWAPDGSGFYYSRYPRPEPGAEFQALNYNQTLHFHALGTGQADDPVIYERPDDPEISVRAYKVAERFLIVVMGKGTDARYELAVKDLERPADPPQQIVTGFENDYRVFAADDRVLYVQTNRNAPNNRVVAIDLDNPAESAWQELVAEGPSVLQASSRVGDVVVLNYLEDVKSVIRRVSLDGEALGEVALPGIGSVSGFAGREDDSESFYSFSSYNAPTTIYRYDAVADSSAIFRAPETPFDPGEYLVQQVFYASADGTRVPMFISHHRDLDLGGGAPTLLYGYGGFNISLRPGFSVASLAWMEMGGVYAVANLRGGGEYGKDWHEAGRLENKQNVFDDFIAAAEYLLDNGYSTREQLGIIGRSNGGLLVGAVTNQRPELFAVALPAVGVMDMLRFDRFTSGRFWRDDYGSPSENEADFRVNLAFSPYHNIANGVDYPAVLITTADTDDRVVPGHSFKYAAALQAADTAAAPKLIRIETRAGHGSGKPTGKVIEETADIWAFLAEHTGVELPEAYGR